MSKMVRFTALPIGAHFRYDGDKFIKTAETTAWEIKNGRRWKEWAFLGNDKVEAV